MTTSAARQRGVPVPDPTPRTAIIRPGGAAYRLTGALLVVATAAAATTFFARRLLLGPAVMNGSARGTALIVLLIAVPMAAVSMPLAARGSARAVITWLGAVAYLLYNSVLFVFATPLNDLFLLYLAMLSLSIWSVVAVLRGVDARALGDRVSARLPVRGIAVYTLVVVVLNAAAWLRVVVPAIVRNDPLSVLSGTGIATNPVYVQDLAFWLPLASVASIWLWRRENRGYLVAGSVLTMWVVESAGIAVDQWFGHAADPASTVASAAMVPAFAVLAAIGLVPLFFYYRSIDSDRGD